MLLLTDLGLLQLELEFVTLTLNLVHLVFKAIRLLRTFFFLTLCRLQLPREVILQASLLRL